MYLCVLISWQSGLWALIHNPNKWTTVSWTHQVFTISCPFICYFLFWDYPFIFHLTNFILENPVPMFSRWGIQFLANRISCRVCKALLEYTSHHIYLFTSGLTASLDSLLLKDNILMQFTFVLPTPREVSISYHVLVKCLLNGCVPNPFKRTPFYLFSNHNC